MRKNVNTVCVCVFKVFFSQLLKNLNSEEIVFSAYPLNKNERFLSCLIFSFLHVLLHIKIHGFIFVHKMYV